MLLRLQGGFGNQLFQLLALRYLAAQHPDEDRQVFIGHLHKFKTKRHLEISRFIGDEQITDSVGKLDQLFFTTRVSRLLSKVALHAVERVEQLDHWKGQCLNGYFQDMYRYPDRGLLRNELTLLDEVVRNENRQNNIRPEESDCAIHLRLTDFVRSNADREFLMSYRVPYIKAAMGRFRKEYKVSRFVLFSDEPLAAKSLLDEPGVVLYSESGYFRSTLFDEFCTLSAFRYMIGSNSTFSFWAGLIGATKTIAFPSRWSRSSELENQTFHHNLLRFSEFSDHTHDVIKL